MPTIYLYKGMEFYFWSNEHGVHGLVHVHVAYQGDVSVIVLLYKNGVFQGVEVKRSSGSRPIPSKELKTAVALVKKKEKEIEKKWSDYFVKNKKPKVEIITRNIT